MSNQFIYDNYFETIEPIWALFFAGKISLAERDSRLQGYRVILHEEQQKRNETDRKEEWKLRK
jgi:hypothetical protein